MKMEKKTESEYFIYIKNKKTGAEEWVDPLKFLEYLYEIEEKILQK